MTDFEHVSDAFAGALQAREYNELTPVQISVLDPELQQSDLLVSAQTGSGKTVAFGMALGPTILNKDNRFDHGGKPAALIIAPTRELALQVKRELEWLYKNTGARFASCVGGMDMRAERRSLSGGANIVVGTPGRLRDHIERNSLDMSQMKAIVLDEADEMLDMGFRDDLEFILDAAPAERRTLMFSATVPDSITRLTKRYQKDAIRLTTISDRKQHLDIEYRAFGIVAKDRENAIINILRFYEARNAIVFCNTRASVNHLTARLSNRGFSVVALSGELSQNERTHALQAMRDGRARVCIATDVAARGIDLPNLELVIHAELPKNAEGVLHRSGRTGRAGRKGVSALIVSHNARQRTERLLKSAKIKAEWASPPTVEEVLARDNQRIMEDQSFADPVSDKEAEFARLLLDKHGADKVAAAFVRLYRSGQSAPEELLNVPPPSEKRKQGKRADFEGGVWFSLSIGRKHNAEPRWLLPMLCRNGELVKSDIGAIKIDQNESYVELAPGCVDHFIATIGPDSRIEKNVVITRLDRKPNVSRFSSDRNDRRDRKPRRDRRPSYDKPRRDDRRAKSSDDKPGDGDWTSKPDRQKPPRDKKRSRPDAGKPQRSRKSKSATPAGTAPAKSKLSPAQKKRKKLRKQMRKQGRA